MYDVIVIGAGPAGMAAGIYAAAEKLKTFVIAEKTPEKAGSGFDIIDYQILQKEFKKALKEFKEYLEIKDKTKVIGIEKNVISFSVEIQTGFIYYAKSLVIASGKSGAVFDMVTNKDVNDKIKVDANMATSVPGIFAVGDVNDASGKNLAIVIGEGAKAALNAKQHINRKK